jgi:hypothetical protein
MGAPQVQGSYAPSLATVKLTLNFGREHFGVDFIDEH